MDQVDLFEINEAFASLGVAVTRELKLNPEKVCQYDNENSSEILKSTRLIFTMFV